MKFHDDRLNSAYIHIESQRKQISALKKLTEGGLETQLKRIKLMETQKIEDEFKHNDTKNKLEQLLDAVNTMK